MIVITFPILIFFNALYLGDAWPYLTILLAGIVMAFLSFYQLIQYMWRQNRES